MSHPVRALVNYTDGINLWRGYLPLYVSRCQLHARLRRFQEALADCNEVLRREPGDIEGAIYAVEAYVGRAIVHLLEERLDEAVGDCDSILKVRPRNAPALYIRGLGKLRTGDKAGGEADIAAAKAINPEIALALVNRGLNP